MIKVNDRVKFIHPYSDEDPNQLYIVKGIEVQRAMVEPIIPDMPYLPLYRVPISELELA